MRTGCRQLSFLGSVRPLVPGNHDPFSEPHALLIPGVCVPGTCMSPSRVTGTLKLPRQRIPNPPLEWHRGFHVLFYFTLFSIYVYVFKIDFTFESFLF